MLERSIGGNQPAGWLSSHFPIFLCWVAMFGTMRAHSLIVGAVPQWRLIVKDGDKREERTFLGLRRFSDVVVAVSDRHQVTLIPNLISACDPLLTFAWQSWSP